MAGPHFLVPQIPLSRVSTVRLGAGNASNQRFKDTDAGKIVKLVGESRFDLAAVGNPIEAVVVSVEIATSDGYSVGSIKQDERFFATADGLQATPGTGALAINDIVVAGTPVALNVAMPGYPKVCKATDQTQARFAWRVVSLSDGTTVGAGAVGTTVVVERIS